jgi:hypothetical protein
MKKIFFAYLHFILMALVFTTSLHAEEKKLLDSYEYKKRGFQLGGELTTLIGIAPEAGIAPGKLDFLIGYQVNPHLAFYADLWTLWFLAYAAEFNTKVNFTDAKISPYFTGTVGGGGAFLLEDDDDTFGSFFTYSAGLGVDFHLWRKATLFAEGKYRGATGVSDLNDGSVHGLEFGVGLRWTF